MSPMFILLAAAGGASSGGFDWSNFNFAGPIAGTGIVGVIVVMLLGRIKIMPTYVFDDAKREWERERDAIIAEAARERAKSEAESKRERDNILADFERQRSEFIKDRDRERESYERDITALKTSLQTAQDVYANQVVPTLTRVLDAERELVDLRRAEQEDRRRRGVE